MGNQDAFSKYVQNACQYALLEYELGIDANFTIFYLDPTMVDVLGSCWMNNVSVPDAGNLIATTIQMDSK